MDPWEIAAQRIAAQKQQAKVAAMADREKAKQEQVARQAAERATYQEMQAAVSAATTDLERFMVVRGAAAMHLLAAKEQYVVFGSREDGGGYSSVYIDGAGIGHEVGHRSGYGYEPSKNEPDTASEAVYYFAYFGEGKGKPQVVRGIVEWLERKIDNIAGL